MQGPIEKLRPDCLSGHTFQDLQNIQTEVANSFSVVGALLLRLNVR